MGSYMLIGFFFDINPITYTELSLFSNLLVLFSDSKHGMSIDDLELQTLLKEDPFPNDSEVTR